MLEAHGSTCDRPTPNPTTPSQVPGDGAMPPTPSTSPSFDARSCSVCGGSVERQLATPAARPHGVDRTAAEPVPAAAGKHEGGGRDGSKAERRLDEEQVEAMRLVFNVLDRDKSSFLDLSELAVFAAKVGLEAREPEQLRKLAEELKLDVNRISFDEMLRMVEYMDADCDGDEASAAVARLTEVWDDYSEAVIKPRAEQLMRMRLELIDNQLSARRDRAQSSANVTGELAGNSKFMINPVWTFNSVWNLVMTVLIFSELFSVPVCAAFGEINEQMAGWTIFIDVAFALDLAKNFNTGFVLFVDRAERTITNQVWPGAALGNVVVMDRRRASLFYLRSYFVIDFLSVVPFDLVIKAFLKSDAANNREGALAVGHAIGGLKLLRLIKLTKLRRLLSVSAFRSHLLTLRRFAEEKLRFDPPPLFYDSCKLLILLLIVAHWTASLSYLLIVINDMPKNSWVEQYGIADMSPWRRYSMCLWRSLYHIIGGEQMLPAGWSGGFVCLDELERGAISGEKDLSWCEAEGVHCGPCDVAIHAIWQTVQYGH